MSLLTICQDASDALGLIRPATIISNTNAQARTLLYCAKEEMNELALDYLWHQYIKEGTITGDGTSSYAAPSDFQYILPDTMWDRTDDRMVLLPLTPKVWQYIKAWDISATLNRRCRIIDSVFEFYDNVPASNDIKFEYISSNLIETSGAVEKSNFGHSTAADTDVSKLPEHIVTLGVIFRYAQQKQLDSWQMHYRKYQNALNKLTARNNPTTALDLGEEVNEYVPGVSLKDSGYG
jgi:hypothetical protein